MSQTEEDPKAFMERVSAELRGGLSTREIVDLTIADLADIEEREERDPELRRRNAERMAWARQFSSVGASLATMTHHAATADVAATRFGPEIRPLGE